MLPSLLLGLLAPLLASATPRLQLRLLPDSLARETGAQCLDHSPAGYYIAEKDPQRWAIFLEGGGLCIEPLDCIARRFSHQGSSKYWDPEQLPEGAMTASDSALNPFVNFSQVWVPYCSGDTWLGTSARGHPSLLGLQMSGHLIIEVLIDRLLNTTSMGTASDVVLAGSSAGGIGTFHHVDWLNDKLTSHARRSGRQSGPHKPRVVGFPIEGLFFPEDFPVTYEQFIVGDRHPLANFMSKYLALIQDPWLPPACVEAARKEGFSPQDCFSVAKMFPYTKTPMFIGMNRFDELLIRGLGLCVRCQGTDSSSSLHGKYIRYYGSLMNKTVQSMLKKAPGTGFFVPAIFLHDQNFYAGFSSKEMMIRGTSLRSAFDAWYWKGRSVVLVAPTCNDEGPCPHAFSSSFGGPGIHTGSSQGGVETALAASGMDERNRSSGDTLAAETMTSSPPLGSSELEDVWV